MTTSESVPDSGPDTYSVSGCCTKAWGYGYNVMKDRDVGSSVSIEPYLQILTLRGLLFDALAQHLASPEGDDRTSDARNNEGVNNSTGDVSP